MNSSKNPMGVGGIKMTAWNINENQPSFSSQEFPPLHYTIYKKVDSYWKGPEN